MELKLIQIVTLLCLSSTIFACLVKTYDKSNSFVCVCNDQYCDKLPTGLLSTSDALTVYKSDSSYARLSKSIIPDSELFNENDNHSSSHLHVTLNVTDKLQSIVGFGGAFTDSSGININKLNQNLRDSLIDDYFGSDGAEYNLGRVPIAGSDFSDRPYSYDDVVDDFELTHFALAPDDFNYKIPYIKKAKSLNNNLKLFGSPWAPPVWLKTNNRSEGMGILIGEPGSLHWKTWANYFVKFFEAYKQNGIEFWGLTPQNEPLTGFSPGYPWNTLGFSSAMMREFIKKDLGPTLKAAGYGPDKIKIMIYDHNNNEIVPYVRGILSNKEAASYVAGIAYHWYTLENYYDELNKVHEMFPDYFLLSTESCEGWVRGREDNKVTLGNWTRAETYAFDIIEGLNRWSTGWVDWNLVLDLKGSPNWANNYVDAPIIVADDGSEYYKQPMFYSLVHFSKFLKPGSRRVTHSIEVKNQSIGDKVKLTTFVNPSNELVVVIVNANDSPVKISFQGIDGSRTFTLGIDGHSMQSLVKPL